MAAKLKIAGAWTGIVEAVLEEWTLLRLREEVAHRSNCEPSSIKLICGGRVLKDDTGVSVLTELGLKNNVKVLATKVSADEGKSLKQELMAHELRSAALTRLKEAVTRLATRHADGSIPLEDYNLELEDQSGEKINMGSETDRRAIMMGLMLHTKGKKLMGTQEFKDALEVLEMGEEAFSLCDPKLIEHVDNVSFLQIDIVWCYFMLREINLLSVAGERLAKARAGIERAHGKDGSRMRLLQGTRNAQLPLYLRLELLEGVAAFHCGKLERSREALTSAKAKFAKLQVSDEALSLVMGMGYREDEARRALKLNEQDVESAINFLVDDREMKEKKRADNLKRQMEIMELKKFGKTPLGKAVVLDRLNYIESIGFERELAAEALRQHENDLQRALDDLTNPELNSRIQLDIESKKRKRKQEREESRVAHLVAMGFDRSRVIAALNSSSTRTGALNELLAQRGQNQTASVSGIANPTPDSAPVTEGERVSLSSSSGDDSDSPSSSHGAQERDMASEYELANDVARGDAFQDYDIDITKEAEALDEYLALLNSALVGSLPSSS